MGSLIPLLVLYLCALNMVLTAKSPSLGRKGNLLPKNANGKEGYEYLDDNFNYDTNPDTPYSDEWKNDQYYYPDDYNDRSEPVRRSSNVNEAFSQSGGKRTKSSTNVEPMSEAEAVRSYTKTIPSTILVAVSSAIFVFAMSSVGLNVFLAFAPHYLTITLSVAAFLATFIPGEAGSFSRASGVFLILLLSRSNLHVFVGRLFRQLLAACMISRRVGFPSYEDPWRYRPRSPDDLQFSMTSALVASALLGSVVGWSIGRCIPFFPTWIGTLGGSGFSAYICTVVNARGDLVRYLSYCLSEAFGELSTASVDVGLTDEARVLAGRVLTFLNGLDRRYKLIPKIQAAATFVLSKISYIFSRAQQDYDDRRDEMD